MSKIEINYEELKNNYSYVIEKVSDILTLIDNIESDCRRLCSPDSWEGNKSLSFSSLETQLHSEALKKIQEFKNTEEFKNLSINRFQETENMNSSRY